MSDTREKARKILDAALPPGLIITSNGATASKYTAMTGLTHKKLTDSWASGGQLTGCNGFTGWYGAQMGSKTYLGVFDLEGAAKKAGKPGAWVKSTKSNRPNYGDILRHASFHVDVCLGFDGDVLLRAAGGQGGKSRGCDTIERVRGKGAYSPASLVGWIDADSYLGDETSAVTDVSGPSWLYGWWEVDDGETYYYYFRPQGVVQYTRTKCAAQSPAPSNPVNTGKYTYAKPGNLIIDWNGGTRETFRDAFSNVFKMTATSNRYSPLAANKIR